MVLLDGTGGVPFFLQSRLSERHGRCWGAVPRKVVVVVYLCSRLMFAV